MMNAGAPVSDELPPWDGGRDRELPDWAITNELDLIEAFADSDLPGLAGKTIARALGDGAVTALAAGEVADEMGRDQAMVLLWLPFFEDQRMYVKEDRRLEHEEIPRLSRWRDTELAIGVLSLGFPSRAVELASCSTVSPRPRFRGLSTVATTISPRNTLSPPGPWRLLATSPS